MHFIDEPKNNNIRLTTMKKALIAAALTVAFIGLMYTCFEPDSEGRKPSSASA
ncbi:MAG: hypothetical protein ACI936_001101 [Paraglaciecola sp.]|jgi:hypothetical protein